MEKYNAPVLVFLCRDRDFKPHTIFICDKDFLSPEFYVEEKERKTAEINEYVISIEEAPPSNYGEKTLKLKTNFPWQVRQARKRFLHSYLADVKWEKMCVEKMGLRTPYISIPDDFMERWLKANEIKELPEEEHFFVPIRWVAWDIETNVEPIWPTFTGWKDAEKCDIISISAYDSYEDEYQRFAWHPDAERSDVKTRWWRNGYYYVPANKKHTVYDKQTWVYTHYYNNEKDMLKAYFDWFNKIRPDAQLGFNSEGGYRISTRKGYSRKYWFNGFDMPFLYHRAKTLDLLKQIQKLSPLPNHVKGVKWRSNGDRQTAQIEGVCQVDFIYTNEIFMYHKKFNDFREGNLDGYMRYFVGFGKVHHAEQIWEMWKNKTPSDYDPANPAKFGVEKRKNLVKELYDNAKLSVSDA